MSIRAHHKGPARNAAGATMIELILVLAILSFIAVVNWPTQSGRLERAHIDALRQTMQGMVDEVQLWARSGSPSTFDEDGGHEYIVQHPNQLPPASNRQVSQLNDRMNANMPARNRYGGRFYFDSGAGDRVFIRTTIDVDALSAPPSIENADVTTSNGKYRIRLMARAMTGPSAGDRVRRTRHLLETLSPP